MSALLSAPATSPDNKAGSISLAGLNDVSGATRGERAILAVSEPIQRPTRLLRPTLRDVAQRAGVSNMTVSRVVNRVRSVGPTTRERVEQAIRELNYVPNLAAQALATTQLPDKIALLFDTQDVTALGEMVSIGSDEAVRLNVKLVFVKVRKDDDPLRTLETLNNLEIRGVLLSAPLCDDVRLSVVLREAGVRIVAVGSSSAEPDFSSIGIDDERAAHDLTRYLLRLGHRRIGFITGHPRHRSSARRRAGYEAALIEHRIKRDKALQWEAPSIFDSSLAAAEALTRGPRVTAILASTNDMAAALVSIAQARGISVPRSLTVCGFADCEAAQTISPRLTSVHRPIASMVSWGIRQLTDELTALSRGEQPVIRSAVVDHAIAYQDSDAPPECPESSVIGQAAHIKVIG